MQKHSGALRVLPGSHHLDFNKRLQVLQPQGQNTSLEAYGVPGPELACLSFEVQPGDVVIFNQYLFHAVYGKQEGRSYIALKFAATPATVE